MRWILTKHKNTNRIQEMSCAVRLLKFFKTLDIILRFQKLN